VAQWYADFKNLDLDKVVSIFSEDAVVTYGSGASDSAVEYSGRWVGTEEIRQYFAGRFSKGMKIEDIRPFCALRPDMHEFGRWVVANGQIQDAPTPGGINYQGNFVQVWSFDPATAQATSLDSFYDVDASV
jgi:hypothetical protein